MEDIVGNTGSFDARSKFKSWFNSNPNPSGVNFRQQKLFGFIKVKSSISVLDVTKNNQVSSHYRQNISKMEINNKYIIS